MSPARQKDQFSLRCFPRYHVIDMRCGLPIQVGVPVPIR